MSFKKIVSELHSIDEKMLTLLNRRMELVLMSRTFGRDVENNKNKQLFIEKLQKEQTQLINSEFVKKLYVEIMNECTEMKNRNYDLIAFQGTHGAYSEVAARQWNSSWIPVACESFADVFSGVSNNYFQYGIVPVENTLGGVVGQVNDLLINTDLFVCGAVDLSVHHCLIAHEHTVFEDIKKVYSHPQALAQCRHFLADHNIEPCPYYDTAGSVKMLAEKRPHNTAVIASSLAAQIYGMKIVRKNIEDLHTNKTRFLILSKKESDETNHNKCSILFSAEHKAGALFEVLEIFAHEHINLTRIESVPSRPGMYAFFMDFEGERNDEKVQHVLEALHKKAKELRVMGFYNEITDLNDN